MSGIFGTPEACLISAARATGELSWAISAHGMIEGYSSVTYANGSGPWTRGVDCRCEGNFTCGHCLRNAKPWHYTLSNDSRIYQLPADLTQPGLARQPLAGLTSLRRAEDAHCPGGPMCGECQQTVTQTVQLSPKATRLAPRTRPR
jgi:hypothetical protein